MGIDPFHLRDGPCQPDGLIPVEFRRKGVMRPDPYRAQNQETDTNSYN
jgi:hypothetical protein